MKRGFAFQQAQIFFYVLEVKRLLAFLFSVLFVDSLDFLFYQFAHRLALVFFLVCCCGRYGFIRKCIENCLLRSKHIRDAFINAFLAQQAIHQHIARLSHAVCAGIA